MVKAAGPRLVFVLLALAYVAAGFWTTRRVSATGDEPHYFMAADALLRGEGFELTARWRELTLRTYGPGGGIDEREFLRQSAPSLIRDGRYPLHDLGLSLLIALPYAVGGRGLVVASIGVAMAAALALAARSTEALGVPRAAATAGALAAGLSAPALTYSGQVFPDALAPLALAAALTALVGSARQWVAAWAVAALPFLHVRYWPLAAVLVVGWAVVRRPRARELASLLLPTGAVVVALSVLDLVIYGVPLPHAGFFLFFTRQEGASVATYLAVGREGVLGIFLDRAFGLIPAAPIVLLAFMGVGLAVRVPALRPGLAAAAGYVGLVSFLDWTGGFSPQARYFAVLAPLIAVLLGFALAHRAALLLAIPLAGWTAAQSLVYVRSPGLRYDVYSLPPLADRAWERVLGASPSGVFPLLGSDGATAGLLAAWTAVLLTLVAIGLALSHRSHAMSRNGHPAVLRSEG